LRGCRGRDKGVAMPQSESMKQELAGSVSYVVRLKKNGVNFEKGSHCLVGVARTDKQEPGLIVNCANYQEKRKRTPGVYGETQLFGGGPGAGGLSQRSWKVQWERGG